jgi:hypothetical protein
MKKSLFNILAIFFFYISSSTITLADGHVMVRNYKQIETEQLVNRLNEIKTQTKKKLTKEERKEFRYEVKEIKKELKERKAIGFGAGVMIGLGVALAILILALIL